MLKEDIYNYIKENNGNVDSVDIACEFNMHRVDISLFALDELIKSGKVERKHVIGVRYAYFIKE